MSILSLSGAYLTVANRKLLEDVDLQIPAQSRIALVGRNGAGKSSLLKVFQGKLCLDAGQMHCASGLVVAGLSQEVPTIVDEPVYHFLVHGLGAKGKLLAARYDFQKAGQMEEFALCQQELDAYNAWSIIAEIEAMASRLDIDLDVRMNKLSGGMKRRVLLAAALIVTPDLLLLDEPTNHLDIKAIEWLESYLKNYKGTVIVVTHDRDFLKAIALSILEIDRGKLYHYHCDYENYLGRREALLLAQQKQNALFDKHLAEEEAWIRTGIKARRTRNEGRVRALKALRQQYQARRAVEGTVKSVSLEVTRSGSLVIEAQHLYYGDLIRDCSLLLTKGDKLGIIGPNGCGKTTLVRLLLGEITADSGKIKRGTNVEIAYFDQLRQTLKEEETVLYNVADGASHLTINGRSKHVASYLGDFLFSPERFNQPVSSLSGGEKNRLLLAKLFARPVNLLVMDEPSNDLDLETLELLETILLDYTGTLILISHDRALINQVVTSILVYEGAGVFQEFVGGYDDYQRQKPQAIPSPKENSYKKSKVTPVLTPDEQRELSKLPKQIELVEKKIKDLQSKMASLEFYQQEAEIITRETKKLAQEEAQLEEYFMRWQILEEKKQ